jgi:hypothetical protein
MKHLMDRLSSNYSLHFLSGSLDFLLHSFALALQRILRHSSRVSSDSLGFPSDPHHRQLVKTKLASRFSLQLLIGSLAFVPSLHRWWISQRVSESHARSLSGGLDLNRTAAHPNEVHRCPLLTLTPSSPNQLGRGRSLAELA